MLPEQKQDIGHNFNDPISHLPEIDFTSTTTTNNERVTAISEIREWKEGTTLNSCVCVLQVTLMPLVF